MTCSFCVIVVNGFVRLEYSHNFFCFNVRVAKKICCSSVDRFYIRRYVKKKLCLLNLNYLNMFLLLDVIIFLNYFMLRFL